MKKALFVLAVVQVLLLFAFESVAQAQRKPPMRRRGGEIIEVIPNGPAHQRGMQKGDWIVEIDGNKCKNAGDVIDLIENKEDVDVVVERRNKNGGFNKHNFKDVRLDDGKLRVKLR